MKIFILEDDSLQILRLRLILESIQIDMVVQTFKEADKLLRHVTQPDENNVYLLDIELKNSPYGGFETSQKIREIDNLGTIIFITTHSEFMRKTYEYRVAALDFFETVSDLTKRKISVYTKSEHFIAKGNLKEVEAKSDRFMRVHRSFVANVENIKKFDSKERKIYFDEATYCLVSRKNIAPLKKLLREKLLEI